MRRLLFEVQIFIIQRHIKKALYKLSPSDRRTLKIKHEHGHIVNNAVRNRIMAKSNGI